MLLILLSMKTIKGYKDRHKENRNWGKSGVTTPGWLSRFIVWEKPSIKTVVGNTNNKYPDIRLRVAKEFGFEYMI